MAKSLLELYDNAEARGTARRARQDREFNAMHAAAGRPSSFRVLFRKGKPPQRMILAEDVTALKRDLDDPLGKKVRRERAELDARRKRMSK